MTGNLIQLFSVAIFAATAYAFFHFDKDDQSDVYYIGGVVFSFIALASILDLLIN